MEIKQKLKVLNKLLAQLRDGWIFVEGKRDKEALAKLGCSNVLTISGNLRLSCNEMSRYCSSHVVSNKINTKDVVFVLTDLDRRGDELAKLAKEELEARSIVADLTARKTLGGILNIRYFEDAKRGYDKIMEEAEKFQI